jgi:hypothetical protein
MKIEIERPAGFDASAISDAWRSTRTTSRPGVRDRCLLQVSALAIKNRPSNALTMTPP